jgi:hypothetical protein
MNTKEKSMKPKAFPFSALFAVAMIFLLGACFNPLHEGDGATDPVRTGVLVRISGAEIAEPLQSVINHRTLLPETGAFTYTLAFTRSGESEPSVTETAGGTSLVVDLGPGTWILAVTACNTGTTEVVAEGIAEGIEVAENTVTPVTVHLAPVEAGTGTFSYALSLPGGITLQGGFLRLTSLSDGGDAAPVDLTGGLSGSRALDSGYYRMTLEIFAASAGGGKHFRKTTVIHISPNLVTRAAYSFTADQFTDTTFFIIGDSGELAAALSAIQSSSASDFIISVVGDFNASPLALTESAYSNKTITLTSGGGMWAIALSGTGSLFTVGSASTEDFKFIVQDIILKGRDSNNAPLVKVEGGALILNAGAKITGNATSGTGGGVQVSAGLFELAGGAVSGNTAGGGGGVFMEGGTFEMNGGSVNSNKSLINAETSTVERVACHSCGGGVYMGGGAFVMTGGGIRANTAESRARSTTFLTTGERSSAYSYAYGGGVYVGAGNFALSGGAISGNDVVSYSYSFYSSTGGQTNCYAYGGGIAIATSLGGWYGFSNGVVEMSGAYIGGNTLTATHAGTASWGDSGLYGGGVYIYLNSGGSASFTKAPGMNSGSGVIYGSNATGAGDDGYDLKNRAPSGGHAVYYTYSNSVSVKQRNTTAGETVHLSTAGDDNWE